MDGRRLTNKLLIKAHLAEERSKTDGQQIPNPIQENQTASEGFTLPLKLRQPNYNQTKWTTSDPDTNLAVQVITNKLNSLPSNYKTHPQRKNLSNLHENGLKWLNAKINNDELAVVEADKGGGILLVEPTLLESKVQEKLLNVQIYDKLPQDPRKEQYDKLIKLWKYGQSNKFVSADECSKVVGLTKSGNKSTSSKFKPGDSYFVPSLKIHKMEPVDLIPEKANEIPARIISCLQDGTTKRSDVFISSKWLRKLQDDYCSDLVESTNDTLLWLQILNDTETLTNHKGFTFDFEGLYDSLTPGLVIKAINQAMIECRSDWSDDFKSWLCKLLKLSMESAVGIFKGDWYKPKNGVPTGGSCSVQLANIAVYFVLKSVLYSDQNKMNSIVSIKRFIDDGVGIHNLSSRQFSQWRNSLTEGVRKFGLNIKETDWKIAECSSNPVNFLDILFWIDNDGKIQTDLYVKPTDSRRYLSFESCHPNHMFAGIVYTQALRIRRIINDNIRLTLQLDKLATDFLKCNYPHKLVSDIIGKVKELPRVLKQKNELLAPREINGDDVLMISSFGADKPLKDVVSKLPNKEKLSIKMVYRTAPSLRSKFCTPRKTCLGSPKGLSTRCNRDCRCQCCGLMSQLDIVKDSDNKKIKTGKGDCTSKNLIYHLRCKLCELGYVGKTVQMLSNRLSGHRNKYFDYIRLNGNVKGINTDYSDYIPGMHLYNCHGLRNHEDFNEMFTMTILEKCSPSNLDVKEHLWIHRLRTIYPLGLNSVDPFGIPLLV